MADADDEWEAEFPCVGGVCPLETREFLIAEAIEPEPALFGLGIRGHRAGARHLAAQFRMATQERELPLARRRAHCLHHRVMQRPECRERPCGMRTLGNP